MLKLTVPNDAQADPAAYVWQVHGRELAEAGFAFSRSVYKHSILSHRESEAARVRTAQINGCQICKSWRGARDTPELLAAAGEGDGPSVVDNGAAPTEAFYEAIADWRGSTLFTPRERAALEFAERMAADPQGMSADWDFWETTMGAFSDAEKVDLTLSVASWMAMGRATHVLGLDQTCAIPGRGSIGQARELAPGA